MSRFSEDKMIKLSKLFFIFYILFYYIESLLFHHIISFEITILQENQIQSYRFLPFLMRFVLFYGLRLINFSWSNSLRSINIF